MIARPPEPSVKYAPALGKIALDPARYARVMLRHNLWPMQAAILRSAATHPRTAVKACHASSKTFTAAELVLYWISRYSDGIAITTAPSFTQVRRQMWVEIKRALQGARIALPQPNETELRITPENYALGISTDQAVRFQGFHGRILIVIDEASGLDPDIWEAIETSRAGGNVHILALGNPTELGGKFYDAFHSQREGWNTFTISAFTSPNFEGIDLERLLQLDDAELDNNARPYLINRRWVKEKYYEWGTEDPRWRPRVEGQFPKTSSRQAISLADVEACIGIDLPKWKKGALNFGGDIARYGEDETVFIGEKGGRVVFFETHSMQSTMTTAGQVKNLYKEIGIIDSFAIDDGGLGGGVTDRLLEQGLEIFPLNFGSKAYREDEYSDLRTEMWWVMRRRFSERTVSIPNDAKLIAQLTGPKYEIKSNGKIKLESKESLKARGMPSPDRADALALALYPRQWIARAAVH